MRDPRLVIRQGQSRKTDDVSCEQGFYKNLFTCSLGQWADLKLPIGPIKQFTPVATYFQEKIYQNLRGE